MHDPNFRRSYIRIDYTPDGRPIYRGIRLRDAAPRRPPLDRYTFDQLIAEARHRVGIELLTTWGEGAASKFGWPFPPERRREIAEDLVLWLHMAERRRGSVH